MNKRIFAFLMLICIFSPLMAQENAEQEISVEETETQKESMFDFPFLETSNVFVGFTPVLYINTDNNNKGGPSSISYPLYFGIAWPRDFWISLQPSMKIYMDYYLVDGGKVYPAEIENRTGLGFSFLLNLPVVFKANFWDLSNLKLSAGIAFLLRFAVTAPGVDANSPGYMGTVKDDISFINKSFYEWGKFIYISGSADWMFNLNNGVQIGPEFSLYIPILTILSEFSLQGTMISGGVKLIF